MNCQSPSNRYSFPNICKFKGVKEGDCPDDTPILYRHIPRVSVVVGQVLASQEISQKEWMKMQQMMHGGGRGTGGERMMMGPPETMMGK